MTATATSLNSNHHQHHNSGAHHEQQPKIDPYLVSLQFVHEYYSFMNKDPAKLHCFYNKKSHMTCGIEGDQSVKASVGQQEIHNLIASLEFENCRALISNIDHQPSANGSVFVFVIGSLSNKGGPYRKFTQSFLLAEQPNGFYILNDVFRFLKDDQPAAASYAGNAPITENNVDHRGDEIISSVTTTTQEDHAVVIEDQGMSELSSVVIEQQQSSRRETTEISSTSVVDSQVQESFTRTTTTTVNEDRKEQEEKITNTFVEENTLVDAVNDEIVSSVEKTVIVTSTTTTTHNNASAPSSSWAKMAKTGQDKWGNEVTNVIKGLVSAPTPTSTPQQDQQTQEQSADGYLKEASKQQTSQKNNSISSRHQPYLNNHHHKRRDNNSATSPDEDQQRHLYMIYIRNVPENVTKDDLRSYFEENYGDVRSAETRNTEANTLRGYGVVEFNTIEGAKKAIGAKFTIKGRDFVAEERRPRMYSAQNNNNNVNNRKYNNNNVNTNNINSNSRPNSSFNNNNNRRSNVNNNPSNNNNNQAPSSTQQTQQAPSAPRRSISKPQ